MNLSKSHFLGFLFVFFAMVVNAQQLHMPNEVEQYMKKSAIQYQIDPLTVTLDSISWTVIEKGNYLIKNSDEIKVQKQPLELSKKARKNYKKAQKFVTKNNLPKTIKFYKKAIEEAPNQNQLINELAHIYWENGAMEEVIFWTKKAIENNPIDFEAHSRLALAYQKTGNAEKALEHITTAHLYNRNHKKVIQNLKSIFAENGMVYRNFVFQPQYKIEKQGEGKVSIQANEVPWQSYAACKALWLNEENYKTEMSRFANIQASKIEQKECLLNALISYERLEEGKQKYPSFEVLGNALRNRMVDDFIFYEIELRQNPFIIHFLSDEKKQRIIRYLTSARVNRDVVSK